MQITAQPDKKEMVNKINDLLPVASVGPVAQSV